MSKKRIGKLVSGLLCLVLLVSLLDDAYDLYLRIAASKQWERPNRPAIESIRETNDVLSESEDRVMLVRDWEQSFTQSQKYTPEYAANANRLGNACAILDEANKAHDLLKETRGKLVYYLGRDHEDVETVDKNLQFVQRKLWAASADRNEKILERKRKTDVTRATMNDLKNSIKRYQVELHHLPSKLEALRDGPADPAKRERWSDSIIDEIPKDDWGNELAYLVDDDMYDIRSSGPDGELNTLDDIIVHQKD